nr:trehalose-phosphatase [Ornithinimicrobium sp. F0845]
MVAVDFDGTLAPLVDDPMSARALPGALELLDRLAELPDTWVAIVSGRALAALRELTGAAEPLLLVGSHGVETSYHDQAPAMDDAEAIRYAALEADLNALLRAHPLARLERKPHSLVLHTRGIPPQEAAATLAEGRALAQGRDLQLTPGKDVLELATRHVGKGTALLDLAQARGVDKVLYIGDDVTDEQAFAALGPDHLTVRVGPGETVAQHRVRDETYVVTLLRGLLLLRGQRLP